MGPPLKAFLVARLRCPACRGSLSFRVGHTYDSAGLETVSCRHCSATYPVRDGIPRFSSPSNYAGNFGLQWNRFKRTQLDSETGTTISRDRFLAQLAMSREELAGLTVLDVGCGAGRFSEVALSAGATVVGVDYSSAIDAAADNLGEFPNFHPVQADVYALPFAPGGFDIVYCLGCLQHTPDAEQAFRALVSQVRPGGRLVVDVYRRGWRDRLHPKRLLRPMTTRMDQKRLLSIIERTAPMLLWISRLVGLVPVVGRHLRKFVPVANYEGVLPLSPSQLEEWAILDTFDWLGPRYDTPQNASTLQRWQTDAGLVDAEVVLTHHLTARGRVPIRD